MKKIVIETAIETLLSTLLPIKSILFVQKIPRSIWEDYFLLGYLITIMTKGLEQMAKETGEEVSFDDFKYIIEKADPYNATFVINKFENIESTSDEDGKELNRGEEIAEKSLYLFYGEDNTVFPHIDSNDPIIVEAKRKAPDMGKIFQMFKSEDVNISNMNLNQMAAMAINYDYVFGYVKENIAKFEDNEESINQFKTNYDDSWTNKENDRSSHSQKKDSDPREKVTLRDVFKSSSQIFGKGAKQGFKYAKKGFNKALDADLKEVAKKTDDVVEKVADQVVKGTGKVIEGTFEFIFDFIKTVVTWIIWGLGLCAVIYFLLWLYVNYLS